MIVIKMDLKFSDLQKLFSDCSPADVHQLITEFFNLKCLWEKHKNSIDSVKACCDDVADCMNLIAGGPNAAQTFITILRKASNSIKDTVSTQQMSLPVPGSQCTRLGVCVQHSTLQKKDSEAIDNARWSKDPRMVPPVSQAPEV